MNLSSDLRARTIAEAQRQPAPTREQTLRRHRLVLVTAGVAALATFLAAGGVRPTGRPLPLMLATVLGSGLVAVGVSWLVLRRGRGMLGRPRGALLAVTLLTPVALLGAKLAASTAFDGMTRFWPDRIGFRCLSLGLLVGAWLLAAFLRLRRGSDPVHPGVTGAALGVAAGAAAWVLVDLWCPVAYLPHLLLGHVLPIGLFVAGGAVVGQRALSLRAARLVRHGR